MIDRRTFLSGIAGLGLAAACAEDTPEIVSPSTAWTSSARRVSGRVVCTGESGDAQPGVEGARVSDGTSVVGSDGDGYFSLVTAPQARFVFLIVPSGYSLVGPGGFSSVGFVDLSQISGPAVAVKFELDRSRSQDEHSFAILADVQVANLEDLARFQREGHPSLAAWRMNSENAAFVVSCGDMVFDRPDLLAQYRAAIEVGLPVFHANGNHDTFPNVDDQAKKDVFQNTFGPLYYSFDYGQVHYVLLDTIVWSGGEYYGRVGTTQLDWLRQDLSFVEPGGRVVVFSHIPIQSSRIARTPGAKNPGQLSVVDREELAVVLGAYQVTVFSGHLHEMEHTVTGPISEQVCGAASGAFWTGPVCADGTPVGFMLVDVIGSAISHQYVPSDGRQDRVSLYPPGSAAGSAHDVLANVWEWQEGWTIRAWLDGNRIRDPERTRMTDPLASALYRGPNMPARYPWIEPLTNDHMFRIDVGGLPWSELRVETTDTFGRSSVARLRNPGG